MAYLGNDLQVAFPSYRTIDDISSQFNGSLKTFALKVSGTTPIPFPVNPQQCLISVNNVIQKPDSTGASGFTLTGSNIVFATAPTSGWSFFGTVLAGADYVNVGTNFPSGSAAAPSVTFDQNTNTGLYLGSTNFLGIATNGVQQLTIDSSGNVVITGTVSSAAGTVTSPGNKVGTGTTYAPGIYSPGSDQWAVSTSGTEQFRITGDGVIAYNCAAPSAVNVTATLTTAQVKGDLITSTTAAAVSMTLPLGADLDTAFNNSYINMTFEFSIINTGATNAVTVVANTGHTIVGSATVAASNSGRFATRRTASGTWVTYRLAS